MPQVDFVFCFCHFKFFKLVEILAIFFFIYSILVLTGKNPKYIFIRLILFIISLLLIPQTLSYWKINITFTPEIELWGTFSNKIFFLHQIDYISYLLTVIGIILFFSSQGILSIIDTLVSKNDVIVYDIDSHACIIDGVRLHVGKRFTFQHNDIKSLEKNLLAFPRQVKNLAKKN